MATNMMNANAIPGIPMAQGYPQQSGAKNFFLGNKGGFVQTPKFNEQQQGAFSQILQQALGQLNPQAQRQQAINNFNQNTVPGLAERFTSMGQGRLSSPAFASQLGQAGANLETQLAALQSQYALPLLGLGLQPQNETHFQQGSAGLLQQILGALLQGGGQAAGMYAGGLGASQGIQSILKSLGGQ